MSSRGSAQAGGGSAPSLVDVSATLNQMRRRKKTLQGKLKQFGKLEPKEAKELRHLNSCIEDTGRVMKRLKGKQKVFSLKSLENRRNYLQNVGKQRQLDYDKVKEVKRIDTFLQSKRGPAAKAFFSEDETSLVLYQPEPQTNGSHDEARDEDNDADDASLILRI